MKFTFKTTKPTGRYRSFGVPFHDIKLNGVVVGSIGDEKPHAVRFMKVKADIMEDGNAHCAWKWARIKREFESIDHAKTWILENSETIQNQINIFIDNTQNAI